MQQWLPIVVGVLTALGAALSLMKVIGVQKLVSYLCCCCCRKRSRGRTQDVDEVGGSFPALIGKLLGINSGAKAERRCILQSDAVEFLAQQLPNSSLRCPAEHDSKFRAALSLPMSAPSCCSMASGWDKCTQQ